MGPRIWEVTCLLSCLCLSASSGAQGRQLTKCGTPPTVEAGQRGASSPKSSPEQRDPARPCPPARSTVSDSDKALVIALLGCVLAFATHARRSAKVVLS